MKLSHTNFAMLIMRLLSFVVSRFTNFSSLVSLAISLMVDLALLKRSSLRGAFEVHSVRKWTSLSILFSLHILQILRSASTGGLVCLPISISSWWELSLSLVGSMSIVLRPTGPTAHWSYGPLVLRPIGPTAHWSYSPLVLPLGIYNTQYYSSII